MSELTDKLRERLKHVHKWASQDELDVRAYTPKDELLNRIIGYEWGCKDSQERLAPLHELLLQAVDLLEETKRVQCTTCLIHTDGDEVLAKLYSAVLTTTKPGKVEK